MFTPDQISTFRRLHAEGLKITGISTVLGISYYRCQRLSKKLGLMSNFRVREWSAADVRRLMRGKALGLTNKVIAEKLCRSPSDVETKWRAVRAAYAARGLEPPRVHLAGPGRGRKVAFVPFGRREISL